MAPICQGGRREDGGAGQEGAVGPSRKEWGGDGDGEEQRPAEMQSSAHSCMPAGGTSGTHTHSTSTWSHAMSV